MSAPTYTPILRWKQAERLALRDLSPLDADGVLPLVEVVPKFIADGNLAKLPRQMDNSWAGRRLLLDGAPPEFRNSDQALAVFGEIARSYAEMSVEVVPVITPRDGRPTIDCALAVSAQFGHGACIRAAAEDIHLVPALVSQMGIQPQDIDLVVDFGIAGDEATSRYRAALDLLPMPVLWRNVIFAGGAFPPESDGLRRGPTRHSKARPESVGVRCAGGHGSSSELR